MSEQKQVDAGEGFTIYAEPDVPRGGYQVTMFVAYEAACIPRAVFERHWDKALEFWKSEALNIYDKMKAEIAEERAARRER